MIRETQREHSLNLTHSSIIRGINENTRKITRQEIELLFVFKDDVYPSLLIEHIPLVCRLNQVILIVVPKLDVNEGKELKKFLDIKSLSTIGIIKNSVIFDSLIKKCYEKVEQLFYEDEKDPKNKKRKFLPLMSHLSHPKRLKT